jgi:hypothetical protein
MNDSIEPTGASLSKPWTMARPWLQNSTCRGKTALSGSTVQFEDGDHDNTAYPAYIRLSFLFSSKFPADLVSWYAA